MDEKTTRVLNRSRIEAVTNRIIAEDPALTHQIVYEQVEAEAVCHPHMYLDLDPR